MAPETYRNGFFRGQLKKLSGMTTVQAQWQAMPMNQIMLQGRETNGFQALPFMVAMQVARALPEELASISGAGDQILRRKPG